MDFTSRQLKAQARQAMALPRPKFWAVALVYILMTTGVNMALQPIVDLTSAPDTFSTVGLFLTVLVTLYTVVVDFGYALWSLWTTRRLNPGMGALLEGFSVVGRVIWMEVLIVLRIIAWMFPVTFCISLLLLLVSPSGELSPVPTLVAALFLYAAIWAIGLRYALAPYLLADRPDDGAAAAVRRSVELMRGRVWRMFKLEFSFIGWELLSLLLSGGVLVFFLWQRGFFALWQTANALVLYDMYLSVSNELLPLLLTNLVVLPLILWLLPYRSVSRAGFYEARLQVQQKDAPPLPPLE